MSMLGVSPGLHVQLYGTPRREMNKKAQGWSFKTKLTWDRGPERKTNQPTNQGESLFSLSFRGSLLAPQTIKWGLLLEHFFFSSWSHFCWYPGYNSRICAAFEPGPWDMGKKKTPSDWLPVSSPICPSPFIFQSPQRTVAWIVSGIFGYIQWQRWSGLCSLYLPWGQNL